MFTLCDIMCRKLSFLYQKVCCCFYGIGWVVGWVGSKFSLWYGLGWVEQIGPMDNSEVRGRLNTKKVCHALLSNLLSSARASYWPSWTVFRHCWPVLHAGLVLGSDVWKCATLHSFEIFFGTFQYFQHFCCRRFVWIFLSHFTAKFPVPK